MTGFKSKKAAALDEDGMYLVHQTDHSEDILHMVAQPAQEPVAWMNPSWIDPDTRGWQSDSFESIPIEGWLPIYIAPPQREWVGLTDDEDWEHIHNMRGTSLDNFSQGAVWAEVKLKEKNNG